MVARLVLAAVVAPRDEAVRSPASTSTPDGLSGGSIVLLAAAVGIAGLLAVCAVLLRRHRQRLTLAMEAALTDPLTELANRRRLDRDIGELAAETHQRVAALMVDVDHFKRFNDDHGHTVGDAVLRQVATLISTQIRSGDVVYRYGGEEFCVLLPGATVAEAYLVAERIRGSVARVVAPCGSRPIRVSIGLAEDRAPSALTAIVHADDALLRAKQGGRDRTVVAAPAVS